MDKKLQKTLPSGRFENVSSKTTKIMSSIRSNGNKSTELILRMALVRNKISGWSLKNHTLPGKPDFYFHKDKIAIFTDGCFWHGCKICFKSPNVNKKYWNLKIRRNVERDIANTLLLKKRKIKVFRFWEHDLRSSDTIDTIIKKILKKINK